MPIISIDVRDGDPTVQASGQHRGTVAATFSDGRIIERNIRAADSNEWNDKIAAISDLIQEQVEKQDAERSVDPETEVAAEGEASIAQAAVAYLQAAMREEQAYDAYLLMARFNNWRTNNGWNMDQVETHLLAAGTEQEEWDSTKAAYLYLNGGGRPAQMASAKTIQGNWEDR